MSKRNYAILGLSENASFSEIRKAYKKLALQYHPDKNKSPGAEEKFKKILAAYTALSGKMNRSSSVKDYGNWQKANTDSGSSHTNHQSSSECTDSDDDDDDSFDSSDYDSDCYCSFCNDEDESCYEDDNDEYDDEDEFDDDDDDNVMCSIT